jgi:seryl-tRNA(Sec) selenium transferase
VSGCPFYRSLSHRNGGGRGKKIQKEKLALTSLSTKIYLKRAGREHTHTHTHTRKEEEEEFKKLKKKLKKKKTKRRRKNGERKIRGR